MTEREYFIDDRCIIPEWIKNMTPEQRKQEMMRLEKEAANEKEKILKSRNV
ncbi:MAG: hypothetical protein NC078_12220 [Ruminococcus sp.]|nr:hypothetical protein [Ruminococcus sp.]